MRYQEGVLSYIHKLIWFFVYFLITCEIQEVKFLIDDLIIMIELANYILNDKYINLPINETPCTGYQ